MRNLLLLWLLLLTALPLGAQKEAPLSAWDELLLNQLALADQATSIEREILHAITLDQLDLYLSGKDPRFIQLRNGETLEALLTRKGAGGFEISWYSIDGGGGASSGGNFVLSGTIGQPDAASVSMIGGDFSLTGGFWAAGTSNTIFGDNFETGDTTNWSNTVP